MGGFIGKSNLNKDNIIRPPDGRFCFNFFKDHRKIMRPRAIIFMVIQEFTTLSIIQTHPYLILVVPLI
jgi:hypothetical protein